MYYLSQFLWVRNSDRSTAGTACVYSRISRPSTGKLEVWELDSFKAGVSKLWPMAKYGHHLFLQIKFYSNTAMPIYACIVYGYIHARKPELNRCGEYLISTKPNIFTIWLFMEVCWPLNSEDSFIHSFIHLCAGWCENPLWVHLALAPSQHGDWVPRTHVLREKEPGRPRRLLQPGYLWGIKSPGY